MSLFWTPVYFTLTKEAQLSQANRVVNTPPRSGVQFASLFSASAGQEPAPCGRRGHMPWFLPCSVIRSAVCAVKPSWAEFGQGAPSSPLVCKTTGMMPMLRSSKASWDLSVCWECTRIDLGVWNAPNISQTCLMEFMIVFSAAVLDLYGSRFIWISSITGK